MKTFYLTFGGFLLGLALGHSHASRGSSEAQAALQARCEQLIEWKQHQRDKNRQGYLLLADAVDRTCDPRTAALINRASLLISIKPDLVLPLAE
jgi:hypothetical protein